MDPIDKKNDVDQWLDEALHDFGRAEPRAGLENRLLAGLQAENTRTSFGRPYWWALGTAMALATVVLAVWMGESSHDKNPPVATNWSTRRGENVTQSHPQSPIGDAHRREQGQTRRPDRIRQVATAKTPRLDQFPSPTPMSEQERMLAQYAENFPERAALVARLQTELLQQDERDMAAPWPSGTNSTNSARPE